MIASSYVVKRSELEAATEQLAQTKSELQRRIQTDAWPTGYQLGTHPTIRLLARSHRRFTEEQKVKVFRSLIKETRITASGVELEMYVQPTQNIWWKYRQRKARRATAQGQTVRVGVPQTGPPPLCVYQSGEVAKMLGISVDVLRLRIKVGKYPKQAKIVRLTYELTIKD